MSSKLFKDELEMFSATSTDFFDELVEKRVNEGAGLETFSRL